MTAVVPLLYEFLALTAGGATLGLAYRPSNLGWLAWLAFIPLLWAAQGASPRGAFLRGWLFGATMWLLGMPWFARVIAEFLNAPAPAAWLLYLLICLYHGLMYALLACGSRMLAADLSRRLGWNPRAAFAAAAVPAMACIDGFFPQLFPGHLANTQFFHLPTVQMAEVFGMAGLAWLVMGFNSAAYLALASSRDKRRRLVPLAVMAALCCANEGWGRLRMRGIDARVEARLREGKSLRVVLAQGAIPEAKRFDKSLFKENLAVYDRLTREALARESADLVLWPENTYERDVSLSEAGGVLSQPTVSGLPVRQAFRTDAPHSVHMLLNAVARTSADSDPFYISMLKGPSHELLGFVGKRDLTPLNEYLPWGDIFPFLYRFAPAAMVPLSRGPHRLLTTRSGAKLGVFICYEALLPESAREYALAGADLFVNPSSDQRIGGDEPEQHLRLAALRAVENRRFLLRPVTAGISAVIDPAGRIVGRIPYLERSFLVERVALMEGTTFHAATGRLFYHLGAAVLLAAALYRRTSIS